jgi:TPR repeat protein
LNEPSAANSFGICLERAIGVHSNLILAACYYKRAAGHDDPDGANILGFCLEHNFRVKPDIEAAAECYKFAHENEHSEADLNYRRCFRILGHWDIPDRSSRIVDSRALDDHFAHFFIDCLKNPNMNPELVDSIERLKATM